MNNKQKNLSRRKFLGGTAAVAALSVLPMSLAGKESEYVDMPLQKGGGIRTGQDWCQPPR